MDFLSGFWDVFTSDTMYASAVRLGAFILFAGLGELIAEKAGTINVSVEGSLLAGAFASAVFFEISDNFIIGLAAGSIAGLVVALLQANLSHRLTASQFVVGLTVNVLVLGLTGFLDSNIEPVTRKANVWDIPGLVDIPVLGEALFGQTWPTYLVYPLIPLTWWLLYRTRWGLEVRAVGENPQSADVSGIDVNKRRRQAIYYMGLTAGLGGGFLILGQVGSFEVSSVGGRGFIAISAVIFGGWTLIGTIAGCFLFGLADAFRLALPSLGYEFNSQLLAALPYMLTLIVMLFFAKRVREPGALAQPFYRGLR